MVYLLGIESVHPFQKFLNKTRKVLYSFPQRGKLDGKHVQSIKEVLSELTIIAHFS